MKSVVSVDGEPQVPDEQIIRFEQGIPGFEELHQFSLVELDDALPFKLLQSQEDPNISFLVGNPFIFYPDYEWNLPDAVQEELCIQDESEVEIWSVITISSSLEEATINLLAPIVLNRVQRIGKQHILYDSSYQPRHPLIRAQRDSGANG